MHTCRYLQARGCARVSVCVGGCACMPCRARVRQWKIVSNEIVPFAGRAGGVPRRERVTAAARTLIKECIKIVPWRCAKMEQSGLGIYTGICHTKKQAWFLHMIACSTASMERMDKTTKSSVPKVLCRVTVTPKWSPKCGKGAAAVHKSSGGQRRRKAVRTHGPCSHACP